MAMIAATVKVKCKQDAGVYHHTDERATEGEPILAKEIEISVKNSLDRDFEGQQKAEKLSRLIITLFGAVGLVWGYIIQQFSQTVYIVGAGFVLAALVTVPPWPMYRRKPLQWQKPRSENDQGDSHQKSKKKK